jgi:ketosteroid isomerase-like protein
MTGSAIHSWNRVRRPAIGRTIMLVLLAGVYAIPLAAGMPRAQKHERRHEIDHLEDVWRDALLKADTAAMNSLLAEDYIAITPTGTLQTKAETIASLRSGHVHFTTLVMSDRKVRFYGNTALVTSTADVRASSPDGNLSGSYRYTRVYIEGPPGVWKIVNFEANRILGSGDHK